MNPKTETNVVSHVSEYTDFTNLVINSFLFENGIILNLYSCDEWGDMIIHVVNHIKNDYV